MNNSHTQEWQQYIETKHNTSQPVKIDAILQQRMQALLRARQANLNKKEM